VDTFVFVVSSSWSVALLYETKNFQALQLDNLEVTTKTQRDPLDSGKLAQDSNAPWSK